MTFLISDTFTDSLARLTGDEQKAAKTTAIDLQVNAASHGRSFHKLDKAKDKNFWSVRVSSDIRLIVHRTANSLLLCDVDHHDKAYDWAARRKLRGKISIAPAPNGGFHPRCSRWFAFSTGLKHMKHVSRLGRTPVTHSSHPAVPMHPPTPPILSLSPIFAALCLAMLPVSFLRSAELPPDLTQGATSAVDRSLTYNNKQCEQGEFPAGELNDRRTSAVADAIKSIQNAKDAPKLRRFTTPATR